MSQLSAQKLFAVATAIALLPVLADSTPARYLSGRLPVIPFQAVGGGEVFVEASIDADGRVRDTKLIRTTPPFGDLLTNAVGTWTFTPASDDGAAQSRPANRPPVNPVESKVLVAAIFRPPVLLGPTLGEVPKDLARASEETPVPLSTVMPPYPPTALNQGVVLVEVSVNAKGGVESATVVQSAPPFDQAAVGAARQWTFRPARVRGEASASFAYIVFGFRPPITRP